MRLGIVRFRSLAVAVTSFALWLGCGSEAVNGVGGGASSSGAGPVDGGAPPWGGSPAHGGTGGAQTGGMEAGGGGSDPTGGMGTGGIGTGGTGTGGTGTGGSETGGSGMGGAGSGGMGAGGGAVATCENPQPRIVQGVDTGYDFCGQGMLQRREAVTCPDVVPENGACGVCPPGQVCHVWSAFNAFCQPACTSDADCGPNRACLCVSTGSFCVDATCSTNGDCGPDQLCASYDPLPGCGLVAFACTTPNDTCTGMYDCGERCILEPDGHRECGVGTCPLSP